MLTKNGIKCPVSGHFFTSLKLLGCRKMHPILIALLNNHLLRKGRKETSSAEVDGIKIFLHCLQETVGKMEFS